MNIMSERMAAAGYRYYQLFAGDKITGYMIDGGNKMYIGVDACLWSVGLKSVRHDRKKQVPRDSLMHVLTLSAKSGNYYRKRSGNR